MIVTNSIEPNLRRGILYVLVGFFLMAIFGVFLKTASMNTSSIWVNFIAYLTGSLLLLPMLYKKGISSLQTEHFLYHFGRALFGVTASILYTYSLHFIPLLNATLLFNTTPLFIPILALLMMHARIDKVTLISILIGFIGIFLIIKPSFASLGQPGNLIGLLSGIMLALAYVFIKMLTPTDSYLKILFYFFFLSTLFQIPLLFFIDNAPSARDAVFAVCAGIAFILAQGFIVAAFANAEASKIGIFQYTSIVWVGIIDWLIWGAVPTISDLIGALLVIFAGSLIFISPLLAKTNRKAS